MNKKQFKAGMKKAKLAIFNKRMPWSCNAIRINLDDNTKYLYQKTILPKDCSFNPLSEAGIILDNERLECRLFLLELFENLVLTDYMKD
jgi:hypothetical protein